MVIANGELLREPNPLEMAISAHLAAYSYPQLLLIELCINIMNTR